ncbi:MAG: peptidyl-prolyl cis-trans isomerase [Bdellovibrio sp.]
MRRSFLRGPALWLGLLILMSLSSCTSKKSQVANLPVLQVNDQTLTAQAFSDRLARKLKQFDALSAKDPNNLSRTKEEVLRNYTLEALISDFARAHSITVSDQELENEVNAFRSTYPDDVAFRNVLAEESLSLTSWREQLSLTLLERKVFHKISEKVEKPTLDEMKKYYEENKDKYRRKERVYLRQIVSDDLTKATELREEVKKKDFAKTATKFSVAPESKNGGLVGWIERGSVDIFDKAFQMPVGGVSQVLESPYGFHILKVERKAPAGFATLEEVKPMLEQALMAQKEQGEFTAWLDRQIRTSRVLRNQDLIRSISVETRKGNE